MGPDDFFPSFFPSYLAAQNVVIFTKLHVLLLCINPRGSSWRISAGELAQSYLANANSSLFDADMREETLNHTRLQINEDSLAPFETH